MYKVFYFDGTVHESDEDLLHCSWSKIKDKPIVRVEYTLLKRKIIFSDFNSYNFVPFKANPLNAKGATFVSHLYLLGRFRKTVYKVEFDFCKGVVKQQKIPFGKEGDHENKTTGWKRGLPLPKKKPRIQLLSI